MYVEFPKQNTRILLPFDLNSVLTRQMLEKAATTILARTTVPCKMFLANTFAQNTTQKISKFFNREA